MKKILILATIFVCAFSCKKKADPPKPEDLIVGTWSGTLADGSYPSVMTIATDLSFKITGSYTATGKLALSGNNLHGPALFTGSVSGDGFLVFTVSSDSKTLTGHFSGTDNGPSAGLNFIYKKN